MKKSSILFLAGLLGLLFVSCQVETFTGTDLATADVTDFQTSFTAATASSSDPIGSPSYTTYVGFGAGGFNTLAGQRLDVTFVNASIDAASVATAIQFHTISSTASSVDGTRQWQAVLTPVSTEVRHEPNSSNDHGDTTIVYIFDMSAAASMSTRVEMRVNPTLLTAQGGTSKLDLDYDEVQGESQDDMIVKYFTVTAGLGGTAPGITAAGTQVDPRRGWLFDPANLYASQDFTIGSLPGLNGTTWDSIYNVMSAGGSADSNDYSSVFKSMLAVQRFNTTTLTWESVGISQSLSTYNSTTGLLHLVFDAGLTEGIYRYGLVNPGAISSGRSVAGFVQRVSPLADYNARTYWYNPVAVGAFSTWDVPYDSVVDVTTYFDTNGQNGEIHLYFYGSYFNTTDGSGINASSITSASLKIYDTDLGVFVPWASATVRTENPQGTGTIQHNDSVILKLPAEYSRKWDSFKILISPAVTYGGGASPWKMGDYTNVDTLPYQYATINDDGSRF